MGHRLPRMSHCEYTSVSPSPQMTEEIADLSNWPLERARSRHFSRWRRLVECRPNVIIITAFFEHRFPVQKVTLGPILTEGPVGQARGERSEEGRDKREEW